MGLDSEVGLPADLDPDTALQGSEAFRAGTPATHLCPWGWRSRRGAAGAPLPTHC